MEMVRYKYHQPWCPKAKLCIGVFGSICTLTYAFFSVEPLTHSTLCSPTGGVALAFLFFALKLNPPRHNKTFRQHVSEFDFLGLFLIVSGVVCVLLGFNQSENSCM